MKPAWSVIFFTVSSGAGLGWMIWLLVARWLGVGLPDRVFAASSLLAVILLVAGLGSSTLHLANRRNAWRALVRWRSSWLSREGLFALALFPAGALTLYAIASGQPALERLAGTVLLVLAGATLYCTAMIYAVLKTVPRWHCWHVRAAYPLLALASGGVLWCAAAQWSAISVAPAQTLTALLLAAGAALKYAYWKRFAGDGPVDDSRASALRLNGRVRLLDAGHTGPNFLTNEFGFEVARDRALRLKWLSLALAFALPLLVVIFAPSLTVLAALACLAGLMVERWLFFAEAQHVVRAFH
jgi:DMSO reductase anchor subunit